MCQRTYIFRTCSDPVLLFWYQDFSAAGGQIRNLTVFKQTACHLAHEANVEKVFSRAGLLADPNLLPAHLSTLVMVGFNKKAFKPQLDAIKDKYYEMFRNKSGKETRV